MAQNQKRKAQAKVLRSFRKVHRQTGALLFFFFFFISVTGGILGWKKHSNGIILPKTTQGSTSELSEWLTLDSLQKQATQFLHDSVSAALSPDLDRIDVRQGKGIVKFIFSEHHYELQLDGATGELLQIGVRRSDLLENIHDGSILDNYLGTENGQIKLVYTTVMALALLIFTVTGFWLWYGPKRMRKG